MAAPTSNIYLVEHRKLITTTGKFWVDGKLLGEGKWNHTRFTVFVPTFGDKWWVGVLAEGGMCTATVKTEDEANTIKPTHHEKFSDVDINAPKTHVRLDEFQKLIQTTGEFYVGGKLLGHGKWLPGGRFIVFVASFGDKWWVGIIAKGGMYTQSVETEEEAKTAEPKHFEKFSVPSPYAPTKDIHLAEHSKLITTFGEFFVSGALLGLGKWVSEGVFVVFVESFGNLWWAGVIVEDGMKTATLKHFEQFA